MIDLDVQVTGLEATEARLVALPAVVGAAQHAIVQRLGDRYLATLQDETPRGQGDAPGGLVGSYQVEEAYSAENAVYRITNAAPYLRYVIDGRGPVFARPGGALRFVIDGEVFFRRSVGPAAPNNFPARARARMQGEIDAAKAELPGLIVRGGG